MNPLLDYRVPTQYFFNLDSEDPNLESDAPPSSGTYLKGINNPYASSALSSTASSTHTAIMPTSPTSPVNDNDKADYHAIAAGLGFEIPDEPNPEAIIASGTLSPRIHHVSVLGERVLSDDESGHSEHKPAPLTSENLKAVTLALDNKKRAEEKEMELKTAVESALSGASVGTRELAASKKSSMSVEAPSTNPGVSRRST
ncbi:hypothetical protein BZA77DRAFT_116744 [Pyronema omphalodes]|nr:hypothetical protein BZA77DRAFT_116744 [Pyronema omphalodes]